MKKRQVILLIFIFWTNTIVAQNYVIYEYDFYRNYQSEYQNFSNKTYNSLKYLNLNDSIIKVYYKPDSSLMNYNGTDSMVYYENNHIYHFPKFDTSTHSFNDTIDYYPIYLNSNKHLKFDDGYYKIAEKNYIVQNKEFLISVYGNSYGRIWFNEKIGIIIWLHLPNDCLILSKVENIEFDRTSELKEYILNDTAFFPIPIEAKPALPPN
ncbi:MAG TPA: hypothetical protein DCG75_10995 [Bacteroidales bacterium]|nr:hypothetical protein [Bacteroidales bacterium]